jgi:hypothetical protein
MSVSIGEIPTEPPVVDARGFDASRFDRTEPLIVRGGADRARDLWTDEWLLDAFGDGVCQVSFDSRPALPAFTRQVPVADFMAGRSANHGRPDRPGYLFHSQRDVDGAAYLLDDLDIPEAILALGEPTLYRLFVGPAGSGTLPHIHTYALNALARGRKHWVAYVGNDRGETRELLAESDAAYGSGAQASDWFARELPELRERGVRHWEFVSEPGDVVFVPAFTIHTVVNLEPVMGFTVELRPREPAGGAPAQERPW